MVAQETCCYVKSTDFLIGQFGIYDYTRDIIITIKVDSVNY